MTSTQLIEYLQLYLVYPHGLYLSIDDYNSIMREYQCCNISIYPMSRLQGYPDTIEPLRLNGIPLYSDPYLFKNQIKFPNGTKRFITIDL